MAYQITPNGHFSRKSHFAHGANPIKQQKFRNPKTECYLDHAMISTHSNQLKEHFHLVIKNQIPSIITDIYLQSTSFIFQLYLREENVYKHFKLFR